MSTTAKHRLSSVKSSETPDTSPARQPGSREKDRAEALFRERFTILERVGATERSTLYLAEDRKARKAASARSGDVIRLEVLSDLAAEDSKQLDLFYLEAAAAAKLSHRNIINSGEAEQVGALHCRTSEYRPGASTLRNLLDRSGWLDISRAINITTQIADALDEAHQKGVLHLQVQPENILIEEDGRARLSGFGLNASDDKRNDARDKLAWLAWAQRERASRLPVHYISPEQARSASVDHRSDLYSLGIVLFEILTDRLPFDSEDLSLVRRKLTNQAPPPPGMLRAGLPESLSDIVMRLLAKKPENRFQSAASLKAALNPDSRRSSIAVAKPERLSLLRDYDRSKREAPLSEIEPVNVEPTQSRHAQPLHARESYEPPEIIRLDSPPSLKGERNSGERNSGERNSPLVAADQTSPPRQTLPPQTSSNNNSFAGRYVLLLLAVILVVASLITLAVTGVSRHTQPSPAPSYTGNTSATPQPSEDVPEKSGALPADGNRNASAGQPNAGTNSTPKSAPKSKAVKAKTSRVQSKKKTVKGSSAKRSTRRRR